MSREERRAFIEAELQKRWKAMLAALDEKLSSKAAGAGGEGREGAVQVADGGDGTVIKAA